MKSITHIVLLLSLIILIAGCSKKLTPKKDVKEEEEEEEEVRGIHDSEINELYKEINAFKYDAFLACLRKGHNNSEIIDSIIGMEFYPNEWPGYPYVNKLKDIAQITDEKIQQDSIYLEATWLKDPNYFNSGNKRVIAHCLELFASEELEIARREIDSIQKIEYDKYKERLKSMYGK